MLVDMTLPFEEGMPTFPGHPTFELEQLTSYDDGGGALSHYFSANTHQGTHIDAPAHFIPDGRTLDELRLEELTGRARVVDLRAYRGERITAEVLDENAHGVAAGGRVVLLTGDVDAGFYDDDFFQTAADITLSAAEWLVDRGVSFVANDFLTEALPGDPDRPVHHALLGNDIPVAEYLCNVDAVADHDEVEFTCLPLSMPGLEASPVRAIARI